MLIKQTTSVDISLNAQELDILKHICNLARIAFAEPPPIQDCIRIENLSEEEKKRIIPFMKDLFDLLEQFP